MDFSDLAVEIKKLEKKYIPDDDTTKEALGEYLKEIKDERVRYAFSKQVAEDFHKRMTIQALDDWIPATEQKAQSFNEYKDSNFNILYEDRKTIYIQPLDSTITDEFLEKCKAYGEAFFFGLPIIVLPSKDVEKLKVKTRNEGKYIQYNATELLDKAIKWLPDDAYGMLGIMNKDIYNREDWNYVFGLGHPKFRTGVFSFARYDPTFFDEEVKFEEDKIKDLITFRSIRVMTHEIGHMFGLLHGVYYEGGMNGSMSAEEGSRRPSYLCVIGLRKLWHNIGFDPLERFKALENATTINSGFDKDNKWYKSMVDHLEEIYKDTKLNKVFSKKYPKMIPKA